MIKERLEAQGIPSPKGKNQWSIATIRSILSNEKYKGDVLLQKTYRPSLFSEKAMVNNGELPKYYISDCLPHIVEPEVFDRAQEELAKRVSKRPVSENAKTPFGRYSGKYAPVSYTHLDVYKRQIKFRLEEKSCTTIQ